MNTLPRPSRARRSTSRWRIWARTDTSRALVGSSATISSASRVWPGSPTVRHALALVEAGAAVAADATVRPRPDGSTFAEPVEAVHAAGALVMADVSTLGEGRAAADQGADFSGTTLSGYVPGSPAIAEGRIATPEGRRGTCSPPPPRARSRGPSPGTEPDQTAGAGYVGYSTPETCWTTRTTWQE
ncbi:hypothetical protein [Streptomyces coelicoflavus]|uniref:hypothetical protein n=1 Tax=Streptomyces coelicoflavus TaxID=285562 RepID=UPI003635CD26